MEALLLFLPLLLLLLLLKVSYPVRDFLLLTQEHQLSSLWSKCVPYSSVAPVPFKLLLNTQLLPYLVLIKCEAMHIRNSACRLLFCLQYFSADVIGCFLFQCMWRQELIFLHGDRC